MQRLAELSSDDLAILTAMLGIDLLGLGFAGLATAAVLTRAAEVGPTALAAAVGLGSWLLVVMLRAMARPLRLVVTERLGQN